MSDLEQRLADALNRAASDAPSAQGLAAAARGLARRRRRARLAGAAAVVALAVGVPAAIVATGGPDEGDPSRVATDPAPDGPVVPDGYRVESWHDVSITVPDTWVYGGVQSWCATGASLDTPRVSRPGDLTEDIACTPAIGYGVTFEQIDNTEDFQWPVVQQPGSDWPPGAYVGGRAIGGVLVTVALPTEAAALDVLATMRAIGSGFDANGCPAARDGESPSERGELSVCRYEADGSLQQSELLSGDDAERAIAALQAAPEGPGGPDCADPAAVVPLVRLRSAGIDATVDLGGDCPTVHGLGPDRVITSDVLYWALSPGWSGSIPDGVPVPKELRRN